MGDMIDRDAVLAAVERLWAEGGIIGGGMTRHKVIEAIRALPAASAEDVRAGKGQSNE